MDTQKTQDLYIKAKKIIPAGTQLLSKRPEMQAPDVWPAYYTKAKGCEVWDLDGNHYYDMSTNGIGSCLLGYANPAVSEAVIKRVKDGSMSTLNPPEEVELAEKLCEIHPWAQQARFTRTGGEVAAAAIRIARATTKRTVIAVCGYHGWHDWYLAANLGEGDRLDGHLLPGLNPLGVPKQLTGTTLTFRYDNIEQLEEIVKVHGDDLAAVIMEPTRYSDPQNGFLDQVKNITKKCGALLIFDEITIGWRLCFGGAHLKYRVEPDLAIFAKALGNGHPIGAVIGTRDAMEGANVSFISSTYWTESVGPVAALAVLEQLKKSNIVEHIDKIGRKVLGYWEKNSNKHGLKINIDYNRPCLAHCSFNHENSNAMRTYYTQLMLERGFLAGLSIYPTLAHNDDNISLYGQAIDEVFAKIATATEAGTVLSSLKGAVAHTGFARLL
ncbi:MAG: aminotransferase class III-fold pyridoxal phosphate-dependent enzyme [Sedimentisphaeraceae bacterium JB056]